MDTNNKIFLPIAVIAAGLLIAGAVVYNGSRAPSVPVAAGGFGNAASIEELTATISGIDAAKVAADVKANAATYQAEIDADKAAATKVGVQSTPSSLIGNQLVVGAMPYEVIKLALDNPTKAGGLSIENPAKPGTFDKVSTFSAVNAKDIDTSKSPFIGKADAPVTMIFWSDFQCPYCKAFTVGGVPQIPTPAALPQVITEYVDTGKVKVVFMDFAFLGNDSITAALYNRAVWKLYPDQYAAWHEAMYKAQDGENDSK